MSPPRRRSARLASAAKPKPVSSLSSLAEHDEAIEKDGNRRHINAGDAPPQQSPTTPFSSAVRPPMSEMHPSKVHLATAGPSAAWLGFRDIQSADTSRGKTAGNPQSTPSKTTGIPATPFTFHVSRPGPDLGLSNDAQRLMRELREDANKHKTDLIAQRELEKQNEEIAHRKIAKARGQSSRFSAAHMAEFKKMDSIENHASLFRASPGRPPNRLTPGKSALKRSPSKASLDETPRPKPCLKRTSSKADLDGDANSAKAVLGKPRYPAIQNSPSPVKRVRQQLEDDASTHRPVSREGTSIPRPKSSGKDHNTTLPRSQSNLAALLSPTRASAGRTVNAKSPQAPSLTKSPSKPNITAPTVSPTAGKASFGRLTKSSTSRGLNTLQRTVELKRRIVSPSRIEKVKSILRAGKLDLTNGKSAIPQPSIAATSKTPGPQAAEKALPPLPFTTPRRKLFKRVDFTPDTKPSEDGDEPEVNYPNLDAILSKMAAKEGESSAAAEPPTTPRPLPEPPKKSEKSMLGSKTPAEFTFRSTKTIQFGSETPKGFGSSPGQTIRRVRPSVLPTEDMPGSFPEGMESPRPAIQKADPKPAALPLAAVPHGLSNKKRARSDGEASHPNKENQAPVKPLNIPHGMPNKKRARASDDDGDTDREGKERGGKRRKAAASPPIRKLAVPKLGTTPKSGGPGNLRAGSQTPSPVKKRTGMTMSRLQMLAQPKSRR
ncbi:hypothetical protein SODALDRAFT_324016 [Sodiomyces alkalinus F11]|uniref:Erythromycin esterase n=1 Tax=Sodiomyces alkalinus (strain CBS 110278 / VKM F-3762 / F11) TaxID=1314773 RepID=A0A3N2PVM6_SODAK|nr:hypothetical protein SODALDRAFT_324016 [Sodiomyces alkalinus F11]ROT38555.1 hypothetical protein SODALDRAFT_324016 [Sodiomyces alkalinus F11]